MSCDSSKGSVLAIGVDPNSQITKHMGMISKKKTINTSARAEYFLDGIFPNLSLLSYK